MNNYLKLTFVVHESQRAQNRKSLHVTNGPIQHQTLKLIVRFVKFPRITDLLQNLSIFKSRHL